MKKIQLLALLTCLMVVGYKANAAIVLDRTRVIYTADVGFVNLSIRNENKTLPYLAQSWIENVAPQSASAPLAVSPEMKKISSAFMPHWMRKHCLRIANRCFITRCEKYRRVAIFPMRYR